MSKTIRELTMKIRLDINTTKALKAKKELESATHKTELALLRVVKMREQLEESRSRKQRREDNEKAKKIRQDKRDRDKEAREIKSARDKEERDSERKKRAEQRAEEKKHSTEARQERLRKLTAQRRAREAQREQSQITKDDLQRIKRQDRVRALILRDEERANRQREREQARQSRKQGRTPGNRGVFGQIRQIRNMEAFGVVSDIAGAAYNAGQSFHNLVQGNVQRGFDVGKMSQRLGMSTDELQEWYYAASLTGNEQDRVNQGFQEFATRVADAAHDQGELKDVLKKYNISVHNADGSTRDYREVLFELADILPSVTNETDRLFLANQAFGEEEASLIALLSLGRKGMMDYRRQAHELGYVMDKELIKKTAAYRIEQLKLNATWQSFNNKITKAALPGLNDAVKALDKLTKDTMEATTSSKGQGENTLLGQISNVAAGFINIAGWLGKLQSYLPDTVMLLGRAAGIAGLLFALVTGPAWGPWVAGAIALTAVLLEIEGYIRGLETTLQTLGRKWREAFGLEETPNEPGSKVSPGARIINNADGTRSIGRYWGKADPYPTTDPIDNAALQGIFPRPQSMLMNRGYTMGNTWSKPGEAPSLLQSAQSSVNNSWVGGALSYHRNQNSSSNANRQSTVSSRGPVHNEIQNSLSVTVNAAPGMDEKTLSSNVQQKIQEALTRQSYNTIQAIGVS